MEDNSKLAGHINERNMRLDDAPAAVDRAARSDQPFSRLWPQERK